MSELLFVVNKRSSYDSLYLNTHLFFVMIDLDEWKYIRPILIVSLGIIEWINNVLKSVSWREDLEFSKISIVNVDESTKFA